MHVLTLIGCVLFSDVGLGDDGGGGGGRDGGGGERGVCWCARVCVCGLDEPHSAALGLLRRERGK